MRCEVKWGQTQACCFRHRKRQPGIPATAVRDAASDHNTDISASAATRYAARRRAIVAGEGTTACAQIRTRRPLRRQDRGRREGMLIYTLRTAVCVAGADLGRLAVEKNLLVWEEALVQQSKGPAIVNDCLEPASCRHGAFE